MEFLLLLGAVGVVILTVGYWSVIAALFQASWAANFPPAVVAPVVCWALFVLLVIVIRWLVTGVLALLKNWDRVGWLTQTFGLACGIARGLWWGGFVALALASSGIAYFKTSVEERSVCSPPILERSRRVLTAAVTKLPHAGPPQRELLPPIVAGD